MDIHFPPSYFRQYKLNSSPSFQTFHLENEKVHLAPASHRCKPEDPRAVLKKKREREVLKRKNYEIKTLKGELTDKEKHLFDVQNKLYTVQHSQVRT